MMVVALAAAWGLWSSGVAAAHFPARAAVWLCQMEPLCGPRAAGQAGDEVLHRLRRKDDRVGVWRAFASYLVAEKFYSPEQCEQCEDDVVAAPAWLKSLLEQGDTGPMTATLIVDGRAQMYMNVGGTQSYGPRSPVGVWVDVRRVKSTDWFSAVEAWLRAQEAYQGAGVPAVGGHRRAIVLVDQGGDKAILTSYP
jgi:hypothetical protein